MFTISHRSPKTSKTLMKLTVINHFHSDQRGHRCFICKQWVYHLPNNHATLSRQRQVQSFSSFQIKKRPRGADTTIAKALHQCFRHSFPTSWHYDRHICWTWYCLDRFRMERWKGGGVEVKGTRVTRYNNHSLRSLSKSGHSKKEPSRFSTLTENQCLNLQRLKTCYYNIREIQV